MQNNATDELILVDELDQIIGYADKKKTHYDKLRHRAFSLFLYDKKCKTLLLHQRAMNKYHSGGLWTNSCCSHPRKNEELFEAVVRRAKQELGVSLQEDDLHYAGKFTYLADFGPLAEYEIDNVVYASVDETITLDVDKDEIMDVKWESIEWIKQDLTKSPSKYSAWFPKAFEFFYQQVVSDISEC